jgi:hypothetical protein
MKYVKVRWIHELPDEPVMLYSELTDESWEVRKVEIYADGRATFADDSRSTGSTKLGIEPYPGLIEIAADPQFEPKEISADEFDVVWGRAAANGQSTSC